MVPLVRCLAIILFLQGAAAVLLVDISQSGVLLLHFVAAACYAVLAWGFWQAQRWALWAALILTGLQVFGISSPVFSWWFFVGLFQGLALSSAPTFLAMPLTTVQSKGLMAEVSFGHPSTKLWDELRGVPSHSFVLFNPLALGLGLILCLVLRRISNDLKSACDQQPLVDEISSGSTIINAGSTVSPAEGRPREALAVPPPAPAGNLPDAGGQKKLFSVLLRKALATIGAVSVLMVILLGISIAMSIPRGLRLDREAVSYIQDAVPKFADQWNSQELVKRSTPQVLASLKGSDDLDRLFAALHQFGPLKHLTKPQGLVSTISSGSQGSVTIGNYTAQAEFEKGAATIQIQLLREPEGWKINGFHINSNAFLAPTPAPSK